MPVGALRKFVGLCLAGLGGLFVIFGFLAILAGSTDTNTLIRILIGVVALGFGVLLTVLPGAPRITEELVREAAEEAGLDYEPPETWGQTISFIVVTLFFGGLIWGVIAQGGNSTITITAGVLFLVLFLWLSVSSIAWKLPRFRLPLMLREAGPVYPRVGRPNENELSGDFRESPERTQMRRKLENVQPDDADPVLVGMIPLTFLMEGRSLLEENDLDTCVASLSTSQQRVAVQGALYGYLCLLCWDETIAAYGEEFADAARASFDEHLAKLASFDDDGRELAATFGYWVNKLDAALSVSRSLGPEKREAMGFSEETILAGGIIKCISEDGGDDAAFSPEHDWEEVGQVLKKVRDLAQERIRTVVRTAGVKKSQYQADSPQDDDKANQHLRNSTHSGPKTCPACGLANQPDAGHCDCGQPLQ